MSTLDKQLMHAQFLQRENYTSYHRYDGELIFLSYIRNGDIKGLRKMFKDTIPEQKTGKLSDNPLRNAQYLFVCNTAIVTRVAVEEGMESETAYNVSDFYIQSVDICKSIEEVENLKIVMLEYFTKQIASLKKPNVYSKPIIKCLDFIYDNLHRPLTLPVLTKTVGLSPSYLSTLFKQEIGLSVSEYIRKKRVEAAENMLRYSDFSLVEISQYLSFCSYSHFADVFQKCTNETPKSYRKKYYNKAR